MTRMQKKHSQQLPALSETTPNAEQPTALCELSETTPSSEQIDLKAYAICYN